MNVSLRHSNCGLLGSVMLTAALVALHPASSAASSAAFSPESGAGFDRRAREAPRGAVQDLPTTGSAAARPEVIGSRGSNLRNPADAVSRVAASSHGSRSSHAMIQQVVLLLLGIGFAVMVHRAQKRAPARSPRMRRVEPLQRNVWALEAHEPDEHPEG